MTESRHRPRTVDVLVAGGCWLVVTALLLALPALAVAEGASPAASPTAALVVPVGSPRWWAVAVTVTVQAVLLGWGRVAPRAVLVAVAAVPLPLALAGTADTFSVTGAPLAVAVLLAGLRLPWHRLRMPLVTATVALVASGFANGLTDGRLGAGAVLAAAAVQAVGVVAVPFLVAAAVAGRQEAHEAGRRELRAVAREQDALVRAAVAQERTAMARELHDIAAHHLSGIALMAAAIDRQVGTDPAAARRSAGQVRAQSTAVLDDLRRLVGLLREDADAPRSVASLAAVAELVDQRRFGGAPVELRTLPAADGQSPGDGLGTLAQLAVYRIVQESLTNAATHAPDAPTVVEIDDRHRDRLVVSISNGPGMVPSSSGSGFGLRGMQERADLLGATLRHGPRSEGGWLVQLEVPRDRVGRLSAGAGLGEDGTT